MLVLNIFQLQKFISKLSCNCLIFIPIKLFKQRDYLLFLLVGAICYFGRGAVDNYAPLGAQQVIKTSVALSGMLQFPKTIVTMILPAIAGAWMAKKKANMWKAMFISTLLFAIPLLGYVSAYIQSPPGIYVAIALGVALLAAVFLPDLLIKKDKTEEEAKKTTVNSALSALGF